MQKAYVDARKLYYYRQRKKSLTKGSGISRSQFSAVLFYRNFAKTLDNKKITSSFVLGEAKVYMRLIFQEQMLRKNSSSYKHGLQKRLLSTELEVKEIFGQAGYEVFSTQPLSFLANQLKQCLWKIKFDAASIKYFIIGLGIYILAKLHYGITINPDRGGVNQSLCKRLEKSGQRQLCGSCIHFQLERLFAGRNKINALNRAKETESSLKEAA